MHAFLLTGQDQPRRRAEIEKRMSGLDVCAFDVVRLPAQPPSIGIADIRDFIRALAIAPLQSKTKIGVLAAMERLTPEAQNALLKTLEEPPQNTVIFAETGTPDALLPTILSRFAVTSLGVSSGGETDYRELIQLLLTSSPGKKISLLEPYTATADQAKLFVTALIVSAHTLLRETPTPPLARLIRNLLTAESQLSVNVNSRLVLDNVFLQV